VPFTDPQTGHNPATGSVAPASWGDDVRNGLVYLATDRPRCRVYNSANFSVPNTTPTAITFDSERFDTGGMHSTSSNTSRITVPSGEGGVYLVGGHVRFAANATGVRAAEIMLNGATIIAMQQVDIDSAVPHIFSIATLYTLAAADYVELFCVQTSGAALNAEVIGNYSPEFWAIWMAT
jgi:hypothetical protein